MRKFDTQVQFLKYKVLRETARLAWKDTLTENLLSFRQSNGGFYHVLDGSDGNNQMSAEQGFYALVAIDRAENGQNSLYRMGDVTKNTAKPSTTVKKATPTPPSTSPA